jgi:hypothetical protein
VGASGRTEVALATISAAQANLLEVLKSARVIDAQRPPRISGWYEMQAS